MAESQVSELQNGAPKRSRAPRGSGGLWRNLAYHRRARLEAKLGEALDEVDRQIQDLRAYRGLERRIPRPWNAGRGVRQNGVAMLRHLERL